MVATKPRAETRAEKRAHTDDWALAEELLARADVRTVFAFGSPGIGKTYAAFEFGRVESCVYPITLTPETPASELMRHCTPRGNELVGADGPIIRAMRFGRRLTLKESILRNGEYYGRLLGDAR